VSQVRTANWPAGTSRSSAETGPGAILHRGTEGSNPLPSSAESATNRPGGERHQVRIRVHAAGVNFADSLMVGGTYQVKPQFPFTPGLPRICGFNEDNPLDAIIIAQLKAPL
jgi:hypothetical protein